MTDEDRKAEIERLWRLHGKRQGQPGYKENVEAIEKRLRELGETVDAN